MWLFSCSQILSLTILGAAGSGPEASGSTTSPKPIATRQTVFAIPFSVASSLNTASGAAAVQLHISTDEGKTWSQHSSMPPSATRFLYRAPGDGVYWFGVQTLDRSNRLNPAEIERPGLIVVVDTSPPKVTLTSEHDESGLVSARWKIEDAHLDRTSLALLYRSGPNLPWLTVATEREESGSDGDAWSGSVSWMPISGPGPLEIRAEVADTAGNRDVSYSQVSLDGQAGALAESPSRRLKPSRDTSKKQEWNASHRVASADSHSSSAPERGPAREDPFGGWRAAAGRPRRDTHRLPSTRSTTADRTPDRATEYGGSFANQAIAAKSNPPIRNEFSAPWDDGGSSDYRNDPPSAPPMRNDFGTPAERREPPVYRNDYSSAPSTRVVNSRTFELQYDLHAAGHSGQPSVELWGTRDQGRTWRSYGVDRDGRSPIAVAVEAEGTYGFRIVVSPGNGLSGRPPRPGDNSDITIAVDVTEPVARIQSAERNANPNDGRITVRWDAGDARLGPRPISLFSSPRRGGPWEPVVRDMKNIGQYAWRPSGNIPDQLYLRLEVRDAAGNIGVSETAEPIIMTDRPPATDVDYWGQTKESARMAPTRYYLR